MWRGGIAVGTVGGLVGGVSVWMYEAVVWVEIQHQMALIGMLSNATGLVIGKQVQIAVGLRASALGTVIHFGFAKAWGVLFFILWPLLHQWNIEATLAALAYAVIAWLVMHAAIVVASNSHPNYRDPNLVIG